MQHLNTYWNDTISQHVNDTELLTIIIYTVNTIKIWMESLEIIIQNSNIVVRLQNT